MKPYYQDEAVTIYHGDCRDVLPTLEPNQFDLYLADPPYGMGKEKLGVAGDNQYGAKLDAFLMECWTAARPTLKDNASAYIWGWEESLFELYKSLKSNDADRITKRNYIIWNKGHGEGQMQASLRRYAPVTEHCLFFMLGEQGFNNNADNYWEGWEPIRAYLDGERLKMGWDYPTVKTLVGHSPTSGMHWFDCSQWSFMTSDVYNALQRAANGKAFTRPYDSEHGGLKQEHDRLKQEHDRLKQEFYATRAYFNNTHDNMTDVWTYSRVKGAERHGHPTPKPVEMMARCIKSSCPPCGSVIDPFMGSGTTLRAAKDLNRKAIGIEIEERYCEIAANRMAQLVMRI